MTAQLALAMTKQSSPKKPKSTKMTDTKTPSVSPTTTVADKSLKEWAFDSKVSLVKASYVAAPSHEVPAQADPLLVTLLCWPRCHGSPEELAFTKWLQDHIINDLKQTVMCHAEGAFSVTIPLTLAVPDMVGSTSVQSTTLFSCHVDTVDAKMADPKSRKKLIYEPNFGIISLDSQSAGTCLGADDSAGIWLMLKMIEAGTPGTYLFHRGEECGGVSAKAIAAKEIPWLQQFQCAVAFDRKGDGDIVTVQGGMRCASEKFSGRLADMLGKLGFQYKESLTGSYTDVKEYRGIIPEVVNVACGYDMAHSRNETLDFSHLNALAAALPKVEWESLPIDRDPKAKDPTPAYRGLQDWNTSGLFDDDEKRQWGARPKAGKKKSNGTKLPTLPTTFDPGTSFSGMTMDEIRDSVEDDATWAVEGIVDLMRQNAKLAADNDMLTKLLGL